MASGYSTSSTKSHSTSVDKSQYSTSNTKSVKSHKYPTKEFSEINFSSRNGPLALNLEPFSLIWCDEMVNKSDENRRTQHELRSSINYLRTFDNISDCEQYIKDVKDDKVFLIVSGRIGEKLVPNIYKLLQVVSIYVYCKDAEYHKRWAKNYYKVADVIVESSSLVKRISKDTKTRENTHIDSTPLSFFDRNEKTVGQSLKSLKTENGSFLYFQLLISVLLSMKPLFEWEKNAKQRLVDICKETYKDNPEVIKVLDEFNETYKPEDAVTWYTRDCCLYKLLNKALRVHNIEMLVPFRFFISDILDTLVAKSKELFSTPEETVPVYRGQLIGNEEINRLQENEGEFVSINSFLSASKSRSIALEFATSSATTECTKRILFEIIIDMRMNLPVYKPFADIAKLSYYPKEEEILFMIGSIFKIKSIQYDGQFELWVVQLILCSEDDYELKDELKYIKDELIGKSDKGSEPIATLAHLGHLLVKMGDFDEAEKCYKEMLSELQDDHYNDQTQLGKYVFATIVRLNNLKQSYSGLKTIANHRKDKEAAAYYSKKAKEVSSLLEHVIEIITNRCNTQANIKEITHTTKAREFWSQGELDLALESYTKGIEKYLKQDNKEGLFRCYHQSALVCQEAKQWDKSLEYLLSALDIKKKTVPKNHPDLASVYVEIGQTFMQKKDFIQAKENFQRAHHICTRCFPPNHPEIAKILLFLGISYAGQDDLIAAHQHMKQGIEIIRLSDPKRAAELEKHIKLC